MENYNKAEASIKIEPDKIYIPNEAEPILIKNIASIITKIEEKIRSASIKVIIIMDSGEEKTFSIGGLTKEKAELLAEFLKRNIKTRKELL